MSRPNIVKIHIILAAFFIPMFLLMPVSGTLYLFGYKGELNSQLAFKDNGQIPTDKSQHKAFFQSIFADKDPGFDFEYIKYKGNEFIFRPSTRDHYLAKAEGDQITFTKLQPNIVKIMVELHKGHGPSLFKTLEKFFGIGLLLTMMSGLVLALLSPAYRKITGLSFALGLTVFMLALLV